MASSRNICFIFLFWYFAVPTLGAVRIVGGEEAGLKDAPWQVRSSFVEKRNIRRA